MLTPAQYKKSGIAALILLALYAVYYFFIRPKTPYQIATELGLYNDDLEHDACLNDMIATISANTGTNLEWELNEAARWLNTPPPEDYWRANCIFYPAGALLVTVDTTFDSYNGNPDVESVIPAEALAEYQSILDSDGMFGAPYTPEQAAEIVGYDLADINNALYQPTGASPYVITTMTNIWGRFNAFKYLKEHPAPAPPQTAQQGTFLPIIPNKK